MTQQKTIYHLIVDKSGSMSDCIEQTITGFNEQVSKVRELRQQYPEQELTIGLTTFNGEVFEHFYQSHPESIHLLTPATYVPNGSTALLDAIGQSTLHIEQLLQHQPKNSEVTVVMVILTDGEENASRRYTLKDISTTISRLQETGKWTFSFIGATLDAVEVAASMSIRKQNSFVFEKENMKSGLFDRLSDSMENYIMKKRAGGKLDDYFS